MIKRFLAFLAALDLLPVSLSPAEKATEAITGPVAKTMDELNAMLDSSESVTTMIDEPFYENVRDEDTALDAMGKRRIPPPGCWPGMPGFISMRDTAFPDPEDTLFAFEEGCVYELTTDGLP